jgi:hypothetical protein
MSLNAHGGHSLPTGLKGQKPRILPLVQCEKFNAVLAPTLIWESEAGKGGEEVRKVLVGSSRERQDLYTEIYIA